MPLAAQQPQHSHMAHTAIQLLKDAYEREVHLGWRASRKVSHVDYLVVSTSHALDAINRMKQFVLARLMQELSLRLWLHGETESVILLKIQFQKF